MQSFDILDLYFGKNTEVFMNIKKYEDTITKKSKTLSEANLHNYLSQTIENLRYETNELYMELKTLLHEQLEPVFYLIYIYIYIDTRFL